MLTWWEMQKQWQSKKCNTNFVITKPKKTVTAQEKNSTPNKCASKTMVHERSMQYPCKSAQNRSQTPSKPGQRRGQVKKQKWNFGCQPELLIF